MTTTTNGAESAPVNTSARGEAIRRRRMALGISSVRELAIRSGVSRSATSAAEHGDASPGTYHRLEGYLSEQERGEGREITVQPMGDPSEGMFVVELIGNFGVRTIVRGPVSNPEAVADMAERLIRQMSTPPDDGQLVD